MPDEQHETEESIKPIRVGVFDTISDAENAVYKLLLSGFSEEEITVFAPNEIQQSHFEAEESPETGLPVKSLLGGSLVGGTLGGLTAVAGLATAAGTAILVAGGLAGALTGGVAGGLIGVMTHRGVEKEPADFYDQAVAQGRILVAVEAQEEGDSERLQSAADILSDAGAMPLPLREG